MRATIGRQSRTNRTVVPNWGRIMADLVDTGSVQILGKVAALLKALERKDQSAAALADCVGEPRSTVYRLLRSLQQLEWVEEGAQRGTFRLGVELIRLGRASQASFNERQLALPVMETLHDATDQTIFLMVRRELRGVCIERLEGRFVASLALTIGASLPLHAGAGPRVLLAYAPREIHDAWQEHASSEPMERYTKSTPTTVAAVLKELTGTRRRGYAISDQDVTDGIAAVGVPVFDYTGQLRASLSVSGLRESILGKNSDVTEQIIRAGLDLSRALGYREAAERSR